MYAAPTKGDLDRNISEIFHAAHRKARDECANLKVGLAARGMSIESASLISSVVRSVDTIHKDSLAQAMPLLLEFVERMQVGPKQIILWSRPYLENLETMLLAQIPQAGFPIERKRVRAQYQQVFQQRLDGLLRDIEIGLIGGRGFIPVSSSGSLSSLPIANELVSIKPRSWGFSIDLKEPAQRIRKKLSQYFSNGPQA